MVKFNRLLPYVMMLLAPASMACAQETQSDIALFHRQVIDSCIFDFKTDPRLSRAPEELAGVLCNCLDEWMRYNHLDNEQMIKDNDKVLQQVALTCFERALNR